MHNITTLDKYIRTLVKRGLRKSNFLIFQLKRMLKLMGKKIFSSKR